MKKRFIRLVLVLFSLGLFFRQRPPLKTRQRIIPMNRGSGPLFIWGLLSSTRTATLNWDSAAVHSALKWTRRNSWDWRKILPYFVRMGSGESPAATGWILLSTNLSVTATHFWELIYRGSDPLDHGLKPTSICRF